MSNTTPAWLLQASDKFHFSIGEINAAEYIQAPALHTAPISFSHCRHVINWRDKIVPVIDLSMLATNIPATDFQNMFVITYQEKDYAPLKFAAFILTSSPEKIFVDDDSVSELPENYPEKLKNSVLSFFNYNDKGVSIFELSNLCSGKI